MYEQKAQHSALICRMVYSVKKSNTRDHSRPLDTVTPTTGKPRDAWVCGGPA